MASRRRALHFGGRAINFIGEHEVGEDRAVMRGELSRVGLKDHRADNVARQQVGRELDAIAMHAECGAERLDEKGLGETGHALEEDVTVGEERDQESFDDNVIAEHGFGDFGAELLRPDRTCDHRRNRAEEA